MLFDVRPLLAASLGRGFSYLVMFHCESDASAVLEHLRCSWRAPDASESAARLSASSAGAPACRGVALRHLVEPSCSEWELEHLHSSSDEDTRDRGGGGLVLGNGDGHVDFAEGESRSRRRGRPATWASTTPRIILGRV